MHYTSVMNKESAIEFRTLVLSAISNLSAALLISQRASDDRELSAIKESVGDVIARLDNILREGVCPQYPDLDDL